MAGNGPGDEAIQEFNYSNHQSMFTTLFSLGFGGRTTCIVYNQMQWANYTITCDPYLLVYKTFITYPTGEVVGLNEIAQKEREYDITGNINDDLCVSTMFCVCQIL